MLLSELSCRVDHNPREQVLRELAERFCRSQNEGERSSLMLLVLQELARPLMMTAASMSRRGDTEMLAALVAAAAGKLYQSMDRIRTADHPVRLAMLTIRNEMISYLRATVMRDKRFGFVEDQENVLVNMSGESFSIRVRLDDLERRLKDVLDKREHFVFTAYFGLGREPLDPEEIGKQLNVSYSTVMWILRKAKEKVRPLIEDVSEIGH